MEFACLSVRTDPPTVIFMPVCSYPGGKALTDHSRHRLNVRLQAHGRGQVSNARFLHFVDCERALDPAEEEILAELLDYAPTADEPAPGPSVLVVPRLGTISPWSSKATEIVRNCGLTAVLRIERGIEYHLQGTETVTPQQVTLLHDRMTESILSDVGQCDELFAHPEPAPLEAISLASSPAQALHEANQAYGLALSETDIEYLIQAYHGLKRDPTDAELMMFAQVNSEHCRHKIFNARWTIDGKPMPKSLFEMIRHTHAVSPDGTLSAYRDNAAVLDLGRSRRFAIDPKTRAWGPSTTTTEWSSKWRRTTTRRAFLRFRVLQRVAGERFAMKPPVAGEGARRRVYADSRYQTSISTHGHGLGRICPGSIRLAWLDRWTS